MSHGYAMQFELRITGTDRQLEKILTTNLLGGFENPISVGDYVRMPRTEDGKEREEREQVMGAIHEPRGEGTTLVFKVSKAVGCGFTEQDEDNALQRLTDKYQTIVTDWNYCSMVG